MERPTMASLSDASDAAALLRTARVAAWVTLALMLVTVVYSVVIALTHWSEIGV
jgi:hypothetical protein